jgi:hypothetical protein
MIDALVVWAFGLVFIPLLVMWGRKVDARK